MWSHANWERRVETQPAFPQQETLVPDVAVLSPILLCVRGSSILHTLTSPPTHRQTAWGGREREGGEGEMKVARGGGWNASHRWKNYGCQSAFQRRLQPTSTAGDTHQHSFLAQWTGKRSGDSHMFFGTRQVCGNSLQSHFVYIIAPLCFFYGANVIMATRALPISLVTLHVCHKSPPLVVVEKTLCLFVSLRKISDWDDYSYWMTASVKCCSWQPDSAPLWSARPIGSLFSALWPHVDMHVKGLSVACISGQ